MSQNTYVSGRETASPNNAVVTDTVNIQADIVLKIFKGLLKISINVSLYMNDIILVFLKIILSPLIHSFYIERQRLHFFSFLINISTIF